MGKVLKFPTPNGEAKDDVTVDENGDLVYIQDIDQGIKEFRELFSDDEVQGIKDELDFLNEMDDLGIGGSTEGES